MKDIKKHSTFKFAIAALFGWFVLSGGLSSCTREDIDNGRLSDQGSAPVTIGANLSSSLTKGVGNPVEKLGSEELGIVNGETLYLSMERTRWEDATASTKVTPYTSAGELKSAKVDFGFMAYQQDADDSAVGTWTLYQAPTIAPYDDGVGQWIPETSSGDGIAWPNVGKKIHFFVYAPLSAVPIANASASSGSEPTLQVNELGTVPGSQTDLLYARDVADDKIPYTTIGSSLVNPHILTFDHALAAIRFKVVKRTPEIAISSVTISGVFDKGTLNMHTGVWTSQSNNGKEYSISDPVLEERTGDTYYKYFKDEYTLMMIPNTSGSSYTPFGSTAKITVRFSNGQKIEHAIQKHEWRAGYALTYIIDNVVTPSYEYFFDATVEPTYGDNHKMDYTGTSVAGQVISYKYLSSAPGTKIPVGWSVEGYYTTESGAESADFSKRIRNGIQGAYISTFAPIVGTGSVDGETYTVTHPGAVPTSTTIVNPGAAADATIAATAAKGASNNPWNLANGSQGRVINSSTNTANTYIINGPGYYCFPIVMGNGVKNGSNNTDAYQRNGLVDYLGNAITDPYLRGTSPQKAPAAAYLVWEDKPNTEKIIDVVDPTMPFFGAQAPNATDIEGYYLAYTASGVTNGISTTGTGSDIVYWVNFRVESAKKQGVAHIAVKDTDGTTMWSWLIWLTDYQPGVGDIPVQYLYNAFDASAGTSTLTFMPYTLGWVDDGKLETANYPGAEVYVRLVQSEKIDNYKVVKLVRGAADGVRLTYNLGHAPFYQFGRPTPIKPGVYTNGTVAEAGDNSYGGYHRRMQYGAARTTMQYALQNPERFITAAGGGDWLLNSNETGGKEKRGLWSAGNTTEYSRTDYTDTKVIKTIYDPCPAGYTVPRFNAFTGFTIGKQVNADTYGNRYGPASTKGWDRGHTFYTNWRSSNTVTGTGEIYFPALGYRANASGSLTGGFSSGYCWSAVPFSANRSRDLSFNSSNVYPQRASHRASGFAVRPQREG
ncbi:MAG: fimbrillin family protein [Bacteroidales bacterium]|nr:fimbrillin family protein [Bacteroidales bacterium]